MRHFFTLMAVLFVVCGRVDAQSTVTLRGVVSETVTLSALPGSDASVEVVSSSTVRLTLSGDSARVVRVPLLVRSNSSFKLSASFESNADVAARLTVADVRATGSLVPRNIVSALDITRHFDLDVSQPLLVLTGPRVSLGGTLNSPNNALQVTVLIRVKSQTPRGSPVHLTFAATPAPLLQ